MLSCFDKQDDHQESLYHTACVSKQALSQSSELYGEGPAGSVRGLKTCFQTRHGVRNFNSHHSRHRQVELPMFEASLVCLKYRLKSYE